MSLLSNLTPDDVIARPFPHVVIENAIDEQLCLQLIREFPPQEVFTGGRRTRSNQKFIHTGAIALSNPDLSDRWKSFILDHLQPSIWDDMLRLFEPYLLRTYPDFEERFGRLEDLRVGTRNIDDFSRCDVLLDSELVIQTPVVGPPCVERGPHLKTRNKPFVGYFYLRPDEDHTEGGDHALYSLKSDASPLFDHVQALETELVNLEKVIPYRRNTFIFFLNSPESIQGLTLRSSSGAPLLMHHILAELREPLFEIEFNPSVGRSSRLRRLARKSGLKRAVQTTAKLARRLKSTSSTS
ncbi:MAG: hypothetical protein QOJ64_1914 [Acidobacteriota bacterium]|jgi:hypothetical protein|nr:hypothetical protein [Acidobacteriota bacterium]